MDIVRVKWYDPINDQDIVIDFTSDDFVYQTCMLTDIELIALTLRKCKMYAKKHPFHDLISIEIIAR